ncbi:enoyl-CoA hydratase-related protein [Zhengella mangrovi]|nr:enoyl-CoA hydratase-related protein [Zhengella mangrovi]
METDGEITFDTGDGIMEVTINRPAVRNALDPSAHRRLAGIFDAFAADDRLRVAIITGSGDRAFCVGSDLKARLASGGDRMPATGFAGLCERFDLEKPVIAAINGDCIGGGLEIVLACDLALTVPHARFGLPEPRVGLVAAGGLHRLARSLPAKLAMEIALTGQLFDAAKAQGHGLVNAVVPAGADVLQDARKLAAQIVECAPLATKATKQMIARGLEAPSLAAAFAGDYPAYREMLQSNDAVEGSRAFLEKRRPNWTGR